jgi:HK97 family phage major capsid protein
MNPGRSVWLCNSDTLQMQMSMNIEFKSSAGAGIAAGARFPTITLPGENGNTMATIMGRPVVVTEHNVALGTAGDIVLADLSQYQAIEKGGIETASSLHVKFVTDETAFRFVYRYGGAPTMNYTITGFDGVTRSPYVILSATT